ncbi:manganese catalase family protein [Marinilabilia sp.]|uniref:manganese catalase family protein n=1 Tax=Marinilabilia sp. TaxID=2021252 RepID=UPI0025C5D1AE|nr:manganese catalase family protein [Marinilabilia sp.]
MLMDIATEELSHLKIVGAIIRMLLIGVNSELKAVYCQALKHIQQTNGFLKKKPRQLRERKNLYRKTTSQ